MQRNDLTIWEQAQGFQMMLDLGETEDTIAEKAQAVEAQKISRVMENPAVQAIFAAFPEAKITRVRPIPAPAVEIATGEDKSPHELTEGPVAEVEEWDPFEDED